MALPKLAYTPVTSPRGRLVHAVALWAHGGEAACGARRPKAGWHIALRPLGCRRCKRRIHLPPRNDELRTRPQGRLAARSADHSSSIDDRCRPTRRGPRSAPFDDV
jgi:hypothetical protein